jgi:hypothetical protein
MTLLIVQAEFCNVYVNSLRQFIFIEIANFMEKCLSSEVNSH